MEPIDLAIRLFLTGSIILIITTIIIVNLTSNRDTSLWIVAPLAISFVISLTTVIITMFSIIWLI